MLKRKLIVLGIVFSTCLTSIAKESEPRKVSCDDALHACELYVESFEVERRSYMAVIKKQDEKIDELISRPQPLPWYWLVLGGVVGGIAISKTIK